MMLSWLHRRPTLLGMATGAVAGLVAITPAAGFVSPVMAIPIGAGATAVCYYSMLFRMKRRIDESLDVWAVHGVGGTWGALATGILFGLSPLSLRFWDPGSAQNWSRLYVPGKRAEMFARVESQIPQQSKVASTDHIHPRFTHHLRSYDYSKYPRAVNDNKPGAPPDADYIVIDTQHYYSEIKSSEQIPELRDHPSEWELLPDVTEGYFIVLKRVK